MAANLLRQLLQKPYDFKDHKNDVLQLAAQPSQIEEAYDSIQKGLSKLTQQLAIIPW